MASKALPKIADVEEESQYGYVFGVSGPGKSKLLCYWLKQVATSMKRIASSLLMHAWFAIRLPVSGLMLAADIGISLDLRWHALSRWNSSGIFQFLWVLPYKF